MHALMCSRWTWSGQSGWAYAAADRLMTTFSASCSEAKSMEPAQSGAPKHSLRSCISAALLLAMPSRASIAWAAPA